MLRVLLDTCVLFKPLLCDSLLCLAEEDLFQPLWSTDIVDELRRNLLRHGIGKSGADHRMSQMTEYFPDAMVLGYERLVAAMENHPKDHHVLAAAVRGRADLLVTENVRDFPAAATERYAIAVVDQDEFLCARWDVDPAAVRRAMTRQVSRYHREPRTIEALATALGRPGNGCPQFAAMFGGDTAGPSR